MANSSFDLIVIGGGPAGYVGAIRAAQLGLSVAVVEKAELGGTCLNWGCIPTKALLAGAEFYHKLQHEAKEWGINADNVSYDWEKVIGRSRKVAGNLNQGVTGLFKKNKIKHVAGTAYIPAKGKVEVTKEDGSKDTLEAKNILVATGARARSLPGVEPDGDKIITSREAMVLDEKPEKLLIVGAGAIGMEFAYFYNAFGTEVTIVEMVDRLLPIEDDDVSKEMGKAYRKLKIKQKLGYKTLSVEKTDAGIKATIAPVDYEPKPEGAGYGQSPSDQGKDADANQDKTEVIEADKMLLAVGVTGNVEGLFADDLGVELFKGHIKTDYQESDRPTYQTSVPGIYATGDVIGPPWLAHVASEEAILCVERIAGHDPEPIDYDAIPGCTYCHPQVASFGKTERALKEDGKKEGTDYTVGKFPFRASGKAQALGSVDGFTKIITDTKTGEIMGAHMIGDNVTELLAELGLARRAELTAEEVINTIHAHPTLSEAIHEAALDSDGRVIHY